MEQEKFDAVLSAATTYANQASSTFNMFVTVAFASLAFSASLPLGDVGPEFFDTGLSCSSLLMAFILLAFYIISFISFRNVERHAHSLLSELYEQAKGWGLSDAATSAFRPDSKRILGLTLPAFGFILGSAGCLVVFVWISNAARLA